jgi:hypothetical protein
MKYFDFDGLEHKAENLELFLLVLFVYILIFSVSWVYNRFAK